MRLARVGLAAGVLTIACSGATLPDAASAPAWTFDHAQITFTGQREGNSDIYRAAVDGTGVERLTDDPAADNFARTSPTGARIAFQSRRFGLEIAILLMSPDGSGAINLTSEPGYDVLPAWSPDGAFLAFMSTRGHTLGEGGPFPGHIYLMNADSSGVRAVTREPLSSSLGPQDWTPDGLSLLLSREVDGQLDLFQLDIVTGAETRLTDDPAGEYGASVAADGRIAFHAESDDASQIVVMKADGTGRRAITSGPGRRYSPRWSPDGQWLLFTAEADGGQFDIRAIYVETGEERTVIATPEDEREPDWVRQRSR